jgi:hypothetical protein
MRSLGITLGILGLWLIALGYWRVSPSLERANDWIIGGAIALIGSTIAVTLPKRGWTATALGVWVIIAGFVPGLWAGYGVLLNNLIVGLVLALIGFSVPRKSANSNAKTPRRAA